MSDNISIRHAMKKYGDNIVIPELKLEIKERGFFARLGPFGFAKTILLRMIAGFGWRFLLQRPPDQRLRPCKVQ